MRLVGGWKEFCHANRVKIGESIMLELIWEADKSFVLKFCSKVMPETNEDVSKVNELHECYSQLLFDISVSLIPTSLLAAPCIACFI